ncbi:MAG: WYL domain-containing protein [Anaerolineaceae bacterium]|nr:WYL domain-containing protein [Anaerolineaceae bacterium]
MLLSLYQKGLLSESDFSNIRRANLSTNQLSNRLSQSDRAYLLSLVLVSGELQNDFVPPPGLLDRLTRGMGHNLCSAAAKQASVILKLIKPQSYWQPEVEPPPLPSEELVARLQKAVDQEQAINVLYQASGRPTAEYRHLTPLLIEQRGERFYLIAYCHTRRANRTFRLDRLQLINTRSSDD